MSLGPSPTTKKVVNLIFPDSQSLKPDSALLPNQPRITKIPFTRPSPHPSFTQKKSLFKNLPGLKSKFSIRCVTRQVFRPSDSVAQDSSPGTFLHSDRSKGSQNDNLEANKAKKTRIFRQPSTSSLKDLEINKAQNNILIRNHSINWIRTRKTSNGRDLDLYHCSRFLSTQKITSFYQLLAVFYESPTVFPYFNKNTKEFCREKWRLKNNGNFEENGQIKRKRKRKLAWFFKKETLVPVLETRHFNPVEVIFNKNFIVFNFESLCIGRSTQTRPGIIKILQKLSGYFHLIVVSSHLADQSAQIIESFMSLGIKLSAFYNVQGQTLKNFKFVDYSEVFDDFEITSPLTQVLIVSNHTLYDLEENFEHVGSKFGSKLKLNCEKVPAVRNKFEESPIVLLLPGFTSGRSVKTLKEISRILIKSPIRIPLINFFEICKNVNIFINDLPSLVLKNYLSVDSQFTERYTFLYSQYFIV